MARNAVLILLCLATTAVTAASQLSPVGGLLNRRDEARRMFNTSADAVYQRYCAACHGANARGGGTMWASELPAKPADLTALAGGEARFLAVIREGTAADGGPVPCPPFGQVLAPPEVERLARHLAGLGREAAVTPTPTQAAPVPQRRPFPWFLVLVIVAELILIGWMVRHARSE